MTHRKTCMVLVMFCIACFTGYASDSYGMMVENTEQGRISIGVGYQMVRHDYQSYHEKIKAVGLNLSSVSYFGDSPVGLWIDVNCVIPLSIQIDDTATEKNNYIMCNGLIGPAFVIRPTRNLNVDLAIGVSFGYYDSPYKEILPGYNLTESFRVMDLGVGANLSASYKFGDDTDGFVVSAGCSAAWNFYQCCFFVLTDGHGKEIGSTQSQTVKDFKYGLDIRPYVGVGWAY